MGLGRCSQERVHFRVLVMNACLSACVSMGE